jgi:hypothetical protein
VKRFVEGLDRGQTTLFPECLDDWIDEDSPEAFVDGLDLAELGFKIEPATTGRPAYHPRATRLKEKLAKLGEEMQRLKTLEARMLAEPDQQISLTDPDSRSMATSGRGSGVVGYNVHSRRDEVAEHRCVRGHRTGVPWCLHRVRR